MKSTILASALFALAGCAQVQHPKSEAQLTSAQRRLHALLVGSSNDPELKANRNLPPLTDKGMSDSELDRLRKNLADVKFPAKNGTVEQLWEHQLSAETRIDGFASSPDGDIGGDILEYPLNDTLVLRINHERYEFKGRVVSIEGSAEIVAKSDLK
jgi:hypothetical protein